MASGGLFICGTERHESRRIDNQLRGRAGRQGDPGESRFFLSAEDDLVRLFAGDRIYRILDKLGGVDEEGQEEPIEAGMLSKQIEKAQKKVEEQNFLIRKRVLEYDDVMNEQRRVIYAYRDEVLEGKPIGEEARREVANVIERTVDQYAPGEFVEDWDLDGLYTALSQFFPVEIDDDALRAQRLDRNGLVDGIVEEAMTLYDARQEALGEDMMGALERFLLLQTIDERWREHLFDMDYLREGIHLRGFAQIDPLVAYKNEAFTLFGDLMNIVWADYARMIFNVQVNIEGENGGPAGGAVAGLRRGRQLHQRRPRLLLRRPQLRRRGRPGRSRSRGRSGRRRRVRRGRRGVRSDAGRRAARRRPRAGGRAQRALPVREWEEVQEVPRRLRRP